MDRLDHLLARATYFSGKTAAPESRFYADLGINGWDFIEFCEDVERTFRIDLRPFFEDGTGDFRDATVAELTAYVARQDSN